MYKGVVLAMVWGLIVVAGMAQPCEITVRTDLWFRSMTEVAGEKEYPDVIIIANENIEVWSVPNRGRIIFDLIYKPTGHSQLFCERNPLPLKLRKLYTFEFGGIYPSFPWHKRDNVPFPLEVEQAQDEERCLLIMRVEDTKTRILVETTLSLLSSGAECLITMRLRNPTENAQKINFGLIVCARPGGYATSDTELVIPVSVIKVEQSDWDWMGKAGDEVPWPAEWSKWGHFKGAGSFSFALNELSLPEIAVRNPNTEEELYLRWLPADPWTSCEVFSWGPSYRAVIGAFDGFRLELKAENMVLASGAEQVLHLCVGVRQG
ncbi:MAG: hypothetical protein ACP5JD_07630 [Candidatus Bipolaricaulaceae bacterium]